MNRIRKLLTTIRFRITFVYLSIILLSFAVVMFISLNLIETSLVQSSADTNLSTLSQLSYSLTKSIDPVDVGSIHELIVPYAQRANGRILVLDTNYTVLDDSAALYNGYYLPYDDAVDVMTGIKTDSYSFHQLINPQTNKPEWIAYYAKPLSANGLNKGIILMSVSIQQLSNSVTSVRNTLLLAFAIVLIAMTVIWSVSTSRIVKPVIKLTDVMRHATAKTFENQVNIKATGEVAELVDAFNRMGSELNAHDKIRDQFVADASHELKTPLASIKALSESVIYCENPPADLMFEFLKDINSQVDRLNNIVQDLLQVARDSSMNVEYKMESLDFSQITKDLVKFIKPVAEKKGLELSLIADDGIKVFGDKLRMERVVTNLIDNAIKYTDTGSVTVRLRRERREAVFSVKDTGIGIPEESLSRLFIRFYRVDKARSRATGGTGLGLSMVEEIVNRHGGNIKVESKLNVGSEFTVRIPLSN